MTSADFLLFVVTTFRLTGSPRVSTFPFTSLLPSLHLWFRLVIGLHIILHAYPPYLPEMISVRQFEVLLSLLSAITLLQPPCDSLTLATRCRVRDFHPIENVHAEHTKKRSGFFRIFFYQISFFPEQLSYLGFRLIKSFISFASKVNFLPHCAHVIIMALCSDSFSALAISSVPICSNATRHFSLVHAHL